MGYQVSFSDIDKFAKSRHFDQPKNGLVNPPQRLAGKISRRYAPRNDRREKCSSLPVPRQTVE